MHTTQIIKAFRVFPLFGGLVDCRAKDHFDALSEFFVSLAFSTVPIWLGGLIIFLISPANGKGYWQSVASTISNGELLMLATAMVAPVLYMANKSEKGMPNFPGQMGHTVLISLTGLACGAMFATTRVATYDSSKMLITTVWIYLFTLLLLYLAMVYRNNRLTGAPDVANQQTKDFVKEFNDKHPL